MSKKIDVVKLKLAWPYLPILILEDLGMKLSSPSTPYEHMWMLAMIKVVFDQCM